MRSRGVLVLVLVAAAGAVALALVAAREDRSLAFTLGVAPVAVAASLAPGHEACQQPLLVEAPFDVVELALAPGDAPATRLEVDVRPPEGGAPIAHGTRAAGAASGLSAPGAAAARVTVGHVPAGGTVAICVRNAGAAPVGLYGGPDAAARGGSALLDGRMTGNDLALVLRTAQPRSTLALLPDVLERAALFRAGWIGAWVYWGLFAALLLGLPALLVVALRAACATPSTAADAGHPPAPPGSAAGPRGDGTARA